jgi:hypothetical protein
MPRNREPIKQESQNISTAKEDCFSFMRTIEYKKYSESIGQPFKKIDAANCEFSGSPSTRKCISLFLVLRIEGNLKR